MSKKWSPERVHRYIRSSLTGDGAVLGDRGHARHLLIISLIDAGGSGFWLAGSALFFTQVIGLSPAQVGAGLSLAGLLGLLATVPIGAVGDRIGPRRLLIYLHLWRACGFVAYAYTRGFWGFLLVACLLGLADRVMGALTQALAAGMATSEERLPTIARIRVARNAGLGLGALVATGVIGLGRPSLYVSAVLVNAATFGLAALLLIWTPAPPRTGPITASVRRFELVRDRPYLALAMVNSVLTLHLTMFTLAIPLWLTTRTLAPNYLVGILVALNTILVILFQVRFSRATRSLSAASRSMRVAGLSLGLSCLALALSSDKTAAWATVILVIATLLMTHGELLQSAGAWQVSLELAPEDRRATYLSVFSLGETLQTVAGPTLVAMILSVGETGWLALCGAFWISGVLTPLLVRWASLRVQGGG